MRLIPVLFVFFLAILVSVQQCAGFTPPRRHSVENARKTVAPKALPGKKGSGTAAFKPACRMFFVEKVYADGRRFAILASGENGRERIRMPGVAAGGDPEDGVKFLRGLMERGFVKICRPGFAPMPEGRSYGVFYVEPVIESCQELLVGRGLAVPLK